MPLQNPKTCGPTPLSLPTLLILIVAIALTIASYWPGLHGEFILDDRENLSSLGVLDSSVLGFSDVLSGGASGPLGRPIAITSFALNYLTNGDNSFAYKYTNLMLHLLVGLLLFWLTGRLFQLTNLKKPWLMAAGVAACWLLTPIQVSTVLYIVQRMTQLSALFVVMGILLYVIGREKVTRNHLSGSALILSGFLIFLPLGLLSKENAIVLPLFLFIIEAIFFKYQQSTYEKWLIRLVFTIFLWLPVAAGALYLVMHPEFISGGYANRDFSFTDRLLTQPRVLFDYLRNIIAPSGPYLGVIHDDFQISHKPLQPWSTLPAIITLAGLLIASLFAVHHPTHKYIAFGWLFYLAGHIVESTIIPLEMYFEHRNYLPSWGIFFLAAILIDRLAVKKIFSVGILFFLSLIYSFATYQRAQAWSSTEGIITSAIVAHPESRRLNNALAYHYIRLGLFEKAMDHLARSERAKPSDTLSPQTYRLLTYCLGKSTIPESCFHDIAGTNAPMQGKQTRNGWVFALTRLGTDISSSGCSNLDAKRFNYVLLPWFQSVVRISNFAHSKLMCNSVAKVFQGVGAVELSFPFLDECLRKKPGDTVISLQKIHYQLLENNWAGARQTMNSLKSLGDIEIRHSDTIKDYEVFLTEKEKEAN